MDCTCSTSTVTGRELPVVYRWPYDYSNPNYEEDFVPQNVPMKKVKKFYIINKKRPLLCKGLFILMLRIIWSLELLIKL
jgi:hypothetical protein